VDCVKKLDDKFLKLGPVRTLQKSYNSSHLEFKVFLGSGLALALLTHFDVTEVVVFEFCNTKNIFKKTVHIYTTTF
jgi:hypothetical protein